jgi:(R,R)-butanediol dehydrogenase/meso-butanediol dehydrogenase/diacetyl reductase
MRAAVWRGPNDLRIEDRAVPTLSENTSIVAVKAAGICATDREVVVGRLPFVSPGFVLGHEITGVVVDSNESHGICVGDRVVIDTVYSCGRCESCQNGKYLKCAEPGELGFTADGGWAEYVKVQNQRLHKIPDFLPWTESVLIEPFACPLGALVDSKEEIEGKRVLVVGEGVAAFAFASGAFALGAGRVDVSLRSTKKMETFSLIHSDVELITSDQVTPGAADISVDSVGNSSSLQTAIAGVKDRGLVICYGFRDEVAENFPIADIVLRNIRLEGHTNPENIWPTIVKMISDRTISTAGLADRAIGIEDLPDALAHWGKNLRTVVHF